MNAILALHPNDTAGARLMSPPIPAVKTTSYVIAADHALLRHGLREALERKPALRLQGEFSRISDTLDACEAVRPVFAIVGSSLADGQPADLARQAAQRGLRTRFILVAAESGASLAREAFDAGMHGCLLKHSSFAMLEEAIRSVIAGRTYWCPEASRMLIEVMRPNSGRHATLSSRDRELFLGVARSEPVKMIASRLGIAPKTAVNRLSALKARLGIEDSAGVVRYAIRTGMLDPSEC